MTSDLPGLDEACRALAQGRAVVVPNPSPMTYGIVATNPDAVNALKQRPLDQNVAVSLHDAAEWRSVAPSLDVPPDVLSRIDEMLRGRLSLLVPLRAGGLGGRGARHGRHRSPGRRRRRIARPRQRARGEQHGARDPRRRADSLPAGRPGRIRPPTHVDGHPPG